MAAAETKKKSYPSLPIQNWWDLRKKFQQSPPKSVTGDYLQSVLGLGSEKAASNLVAPLRALGLVDENNATTDLAEDWRHDDTYSAACRKMLESVYPSALRDALPPPDPDPDGVKRWFARNAGVGDAGAGKMAAVYRLLAEADPSGGKRAADPKQRSTATKATKPAQRVPPRGEEQAPPMARATASPSGSSVDPALHIDIQVHIPSAATPELIDAIFSSMAKHLYRRS